MDECRANMQELVFAQEDVDTHRQPQKYSYAWEILTELTILWNDVKECTTEHTWI